mgnify:CR=1 FL=1
MSEYNQQSFIGGMNLLVDDTRLQPNQYRLAFNCHNRYDVLDPVLTSVLDTSTPAGVMQELTTFGEYVLLFVSGNAYFRHYSQEVWTQIPGFGMSIDAPRFWTVAIPVAVTNYGRLARTVDIDGNLVFSSLAGVASSPSIAAAFGGNTPGLLVQDNINQPRFIYIGDNGFPVVRITQTYEQWNVVYGTGDQYGTLVTDEREYVPIGSTMAWADSILYIASQDGNTIYRSVSGRPLDFVVNINIDGTKGGDATTTSYSVGVGDITCLRPNNDGSLFVAAGNSNFVVQKNMSNIAPTMFGEFLFIRKFLFEATCLSDRTIMDSLGDTKFVDLTGVRSFNAVIQERNEGRNSVFTSTIAAAFKGIIQDYAACILYDNYEMYGMNTIFGPAVVVYDTMTGTWTSFDTNQTGGSKIKEFAKIELGVQRLFAITEDNKLYTLYAGTTYDEASFLTLGISAAELSQNGRIANPKNEIKMTDFRGILNRITQTSTMSVQPFVNNRLSVNSPIVIKSIKYSPPDLVYTGNIPDLNTQLTNVYYTFPNLEQGWKVALIVSWTGGGSLTQFSANLVDITPMNPLRSQTSVT